MAPKIDQAQLWRISYYRVSELAGAVLVGRLARRVDDPEMTVFLTEQCAEEARHAWLWTQAIVALGETPILINETVQGVFGRVAGFPTNLLDIFACTRVFEKRVHDYLVREAAEPGTHPTVTATIEAILGDERKHLARVDDFLQQLAEERGRDFVESRLRHYEEAHQSAYDSVSDYLERPWEVLTAR